MTTVRPAPRWFVAGDLNGFFGLVVDNLSILGFIAAALIGIFGFPADVVFQRMFPGTAFGVLVGNLAYTAMARRLAARSGRDDVTAMPLGLDAPTSLELRASPAGQFWLVRAKNRAIRLSAESGQAAPVTRAEAEATARRDQPASPAVREARRIEAAPVELRGKPLPAWRIELDDAAHTVVYAEEVGQSHMRARLRARDGATIDAIAFRAADRSWAPPWRRAAAVRCTPPARCVSIAGTAPSECNCG